MQRAMKPSSSSDFVPSYSLNCDICMEKNLRSNFFLVHGCSHEYCSKCVCRYVTESIRNNSPLVIPCPHPGCKNAHMGPESCRRSIAPEAFDRWFTALRKEKFYCPFKPCSRPVSRIWDGRAVCPQCHRSICLVCKSKWHPNLSCEDAQKPLGNKSEKEDLMLEELAKMKGWKRCPNCCFYVEKLSGYLKLICR